jgi:hypothetical protein
VPEPEVERRLEVLQERARLEAVEARVDDDEDPDRVAALDCPTS